jgi:hypothetical protein
VGYLLDWRTHHILQFLAAYNHYPL